MRSEPIGLSTTFALVLERHRKAKQFSRQALAESAGLHQTYIGLVERGLRNPSLDAAERLARALGEKLSDLISEAERLQKRAGRKKGSKRQGGKGR